MHENIESLYTLKKVQSKIKDRIVPWIDFSSTSATFNKPTEEATTFAVRPSSQYPMSSANINQTVM